MSTRLNKKLSEVFIKAALDLQSDVNAQILDIKNDLDSVDYGNQMDYAKDLLIIARLLSQGEIKKANDYYEKLDAESKVDYW